VLVLAACPAPPGKVFTYACASGRTFSVTYDGGFTVATVKADGQTYELPAAMSASGARYTDGKVEFWEHQGEAMLNGTAGGDTGSCPPAKK
jgi:membrane-bound inhibitor of C-type lysozyme